MGGLDYYMPVMAMVLLQTIYAGVSLGTRAILLQGMSPRVFVVYRQAISTLVSVPIAYFSGRNSGSWSLNLRSFLLIFFFSVIGITVNQNFYFEGLYLASSSMASAMANLVPAITFLIAAFAGMEEVNIRSLRTIAKIGGTLICVSGAVSMTLLRGPKLLNVKKLPSESESVILDSSNGENWLLGCLCLFASACCFSIWLISQVPMSASHPNHLSLSAWMCLISTLQSIVVTLFLEPDPNAWKIHSLLEFGCCLYSGVVGSSVATFLQIWCVSRKGPLFSAMFTPLFTVIVTVFAALLLQEEIYTGSLIGAIGVFTGLYVVLWGKAEEVVQVTEGKDPKLPINTTEEAKILMNNDSSEISYHKSDLEEPLIIST